MKVRDPKRFPSQTADRYENLLELKVDENGMHANIRQNVHTYASNRRGVFVIIAPASYERNWDDVLRCYECRDRIEESYSRTNPKVMVVPPVQVTVT